MQVTDKDLDKVLKYLGKKIDFESGEVFVQNKDEMMDLLIDQQMSYESLQNVLDFYASYKYIDHFQMNENGFSFLPYFFEIWDEGGFKVQNNCGQ